MSNTGCIHVLAAVALGGALAFPSARASEGPPRGTVITVANCDDSGTGSLRDAIANAPDGAMIDLSAVPCADRTIRLTSGELALDDRDLSIDSIEAASVDGVVIPYVVIDAGAASRVITQNGTGTLVLDGLELRNGQSEHPGGCVYAAGNVRIFNSLIDACAVDATAFGESVGGGLYVAGALTLVDSKIIGNHAAGDSLVEGGGVAVSGAFEMYSSTIEGNSAIAASVFGDGGGIYALSDVLIDGSTVAGNVSDGAGGAAFIGNEGAASLAIQDSTISGNQGGSVGGLLALQAPITIASSTIAFNTATVDGGTGGLEIFNVSTLQSTIVANNTGLDIAQQCLSPPCGLSVDGANDLIMTANLPVPADTSSDDPALLPLADNGGVTKTHALPASSAAIDHGNAVGSGGGALSVDQRGYPRDVGDAPDIGAFERGITPDRIFADGFDCLLREDGRSSQVCPELPATSGSRSAARAERAATYTVRKLAAGGAFRDRR